MNKAQSLKNERLLWIALLLTTIFIAIELGASWFSHSLALLSDAAHLFADASALVISIVAIRLARKEADKKRTYGYYRLEILAAAFNAIILFLVAFFILIEAYKRLWLPAQIHSTTMLLVASCGFVINLISVNLLQRASQESLTIKSAYIDAQADLLSAVGVIIAAILIRVTGWQCVDSMIAVTIALWILPRTWRLLKESVNILLEGVPEGIEVSDIEQALSTLEGVLEVHDIHVWALSNKKVSLTAHFVIDPQVDHGNLLKVAADYLEQHFNITHSTIQIEHTRCNHIHD